MRDAPGKLVLIEFLKDSLNAPTFLLDVGCGDGYFLNAVINLFDAKSEINGYGIDISEEAIKLAKGFFPSLTFDVMDVKKLSFSASSFDAVTSYGVFEHVKDPERSIFEMSRVMKKNSCFAALIPTIGSYRQDRLDEGWYEDLNDPPQMQWNFNRQKWERFFVSAGLTLIPSKQVEKYGANNSGNFYFGFKS